MLKEVKERLLPRTEMSICKLATLVQTRIFARTPEFHLCVEGGRALSAEVSDLSAMYPFLVERQTRQGEIHPVTFVALVFWHLVLQCNGILNIWIVEQNFQVRTVFTRVFELTYFQQHVMPAH